MKFPKLNLKIVFNRARKKELGQKGAGPAHNVRPIIWNQLHAKGTDPEFRPM